MPFLISIAAVTLPAGATVAQQDAARLPADTAEARALLPADRFQHIERIASGALTGAGVNEPLDGFEIHILHHGDLSYHHAFGDWTLGMVVPADSCTKTVSGALMVAVEEAGVDGFTLDTPIADFVPVFRTPDKATITIRQAFSHTAGFGSSQQTQNILLNPNITLQQAAVAISQLPLDFTPVGSTFSYTGVAMQASGAAVELALGGVPLRLVLRQAITDPLEMTNTRFAVASPDNPRVDGGLESSAPEFSRFMDMLLNDGVDRITGTRILSADGAREVLRRQTTDDQLFVRSFFPNNRYGLGVWVDQLSQYAHPVDALAAGARGFHSWIDGDFGLVFTFATTDSAFVNVTDLSDRLHRAVLHAVLDTTGDGVLDVEDILNEIEDPRDLNRDGHEDVFDILLLLRAVDTGFPE